MDVKRIPFSEEEDKQLFNIIKQQFGLHNPEIDWRRIARQMPNRNARQCRDRWVNCIRPNFNKHKSWTKEEDELLLNLQSKYGNKWTFFLSYFKNRRCNEIKNRFRHIAKMQTYIRRCTKDRIDYIINNQNIYLFEDQIELNPKVMSDEELIDDILELTDDHIRSNGVSTIVKRPIHEAPLKEKEIIWDLREKYKINFKTIDRILFNEEGESMKFYDEYFSDKINNVSFESNSCDIEYLEF